MSGVLAVRFSAAEWDGSKVQVSLSSSAQDSRESACLCQGTQIAVSRLREGTGRYTPPGLLLPLITLTAGWLCMASLRLQMTFGGRLRRRGKRGFSQGLAEEICFKVAEYVPEQSRSDRNCKKKKEKA